MARDPTLWHKVATCALVLAIAACLTCRADGDAEAGVNAKLEALKAAGVPVSYKELVPRPVSDQENGAKLYVQAADLIRQREWAAGSAAEVHRYDSQDWNDPARVELVARLIGQDQDALGLVKEAATRPSARFDLEWSNPRMAIADTAHLSKVRSLSRFVGSAAVVAAERGDQAEALDDLRAGLVMDRQISAEPDTWAQLFSYASDAILTMAAWHVVGRGPVPAKEARALEDELGRVDYRAALDRTVEFERCFGIWAFDQLRNDPVGAAAWLGAEQVAVAGQPGPAGTSREQGRMGGLR